MTQPNGETLRVVSIHQPNYIPWLGYFHKMIKSDFFVLLDNVQYVKGTVANRNYIKDKKGEACLLSVSVKLSEGAYQKYNQIGIDYSNKWNKKHINSIKDAYLKAPFFKNYFDSVEAILNEHYSNIADLNVAFINFFIRELFIKTPVFRASELTESVGEKNERNLNLCKMFNATEYLSGNGARKYNDEDLFRQNKIKITYSSFIHPVYPQINGEFIPNLSVIDALFNCGGEQVFKMLNI